MSYVDDLKKLANSGEKIQFGGFVMQVLSGERQVLPRCKTWLGGLIAHELSNPDFSDWKYTLGREGNVGILRNEKRGIVFHKMFFHWRLSTPASRLPRHDRKILHKLAKQCAKLCDEKARRDQEEKEIKRVVESFEAE